MRKFIIVLSVTFVIILVAFSIFSDKTYRPTNAVVLKAKYSEKPAKVVDHSKFAVLQKDFQRPQDVTATCISCHNKRHIEVMQSSHWNWERPDYIEGKGIVYLGKKNIINNYCIGTQSNTKSCAKCHIGFDMKENGVSYTDSTNVDCLVCHDQSNSYLKGANLSGTPDPGVDLRKVAQSVGRPTRDNCGVCHFYGGGGNNIKHGDLDNTMFHPGREIDIHMDEAGPNLVCIDCHKTENHQIQGKVYSIATLNTERSNCEDCHTETPHKALILNEHTLKVACQTCHIPIYSKGTPTNLDWDWSTAGRLKDGEPYEEVDSLGNHVYKSIKGSFTFGKNIEPNYVWFNGTAGHYVRGDKIEDTTKAVVLNPLYGSYSDKNSKIIPVKIHTATQIFDPVTRMIILPNLYADNVGEGAFWKDFDWNIASEKGMKAVGLPYSGKYSFIKTEMYWPINHQVAPKEESLTCTNCHQRENSRLAGLNDFYLPGRDYSSIIDLLGFLLIIASFAGVLSHGFLRVYFANKQK